MCTALGLSQGSSRRASYSTTPVRRRWPRSQGYVPVFAPRACTASHLRRKWKGPFHFARRVAFVSVSCTLITGGSPVINGIADSLYNTTIRKGPRSLRRLPAEIHCQHVNHRGCRCDLEQVMLLSSNNVLAASMKLPVSSPKKLASRNETLVQKSCHGQVEP